MMTIQPYRIHITAILLLAIGSMFFTRDVYRKSAAADGIFHGGCITSGNQTIVTGTQPGTITATPAGGGNCNGVYTYQWLVSTDGIYYTEIPGATGQNLTFNSTTARAADSIVMNVALPTADNTYYQRRATCGSEVKYTGSVTVTRVPYITYYNVAKSGAYTRNNCSSGYVGTNVTYTVAAGTYTSTVSQADADQMAQNDVNTNGQNYANTNGSCLRVYYNVVKSGVFTRNNCTGSNIGTSVTYTVNAGAYSSTVSQADADQKAQNDVNANGQAYANANGSCVNPNLSIVFTNQTSASFYATYTNTSSGVPYVFNVPPNASNMAFGPIPKGTYNVVITANNQTILYEWFFSNSAYYLAGSNTYTRNGMNLNCDCGSVSIYNYE